jgi:hypothetical protein
MGGSSKPAKPVRISATGRFISWGATSTSKGPTLTMAVAQEGKQAGVVTIAVPNQSSKSKALNPPAAVQKLADTLKVGDHVKISYDQLGSWRTYKSAAASGASSSGEDEEDITFDFLSMRKVRFDGQYHDAVVVGKGKVTWTFLLQNLPAEAGAKATATNPDPDLIAKIRKYRRGDEVTISHVPHKYAFLIADIDTVRRTGEGVVTANREVRSSKPCRMIQVLVDGKPLAVYLPLKAAEGEDYPASDLLAAAEGIQAKQKVAFTYRREGGRYLLDEITVQ